MCTEGRSRRRSSWLHGVQGHGCEPEAGKVSGHGLSRREYDSGSRCGAAFALGVIEVQDCVEGEPYER